MTVTEKARAKINLFLEIVGVYPDGYHMLDTVMHTLSLCDDVEIIRAPGPIFVETEGMDLPSGPDNLAYAAAEKYLDAHGLEKKDIYIRIKKRIPSGAGMGGGSADAAAVLRGMQRLFGLPVPPGVALSLGADVPFCVAGGCAHCLGRGERMTRFAPLRGRTVVVMPENGMSTKRAYALWDEAPRENPRGSETLLGAIARGESAGPWVYNTFERVVFPVIPQCGEIKAALARLGGHAAMTGSGSAVFGLFDDPAAADRAEEELKKSFARVYLTELE